MKHSHCDDVNSAMKCGEMLRKHAKETFDTWQGPMAVEIQELLGAANLDVDLNSVILRLG
jgi:hypothetical protein